MPYNKATLLLHHKNIYADGAIVEMKAWAVPRSRNKPEGIKYALAYIDENGVRILGYDNAEGKGHHRHLGDQEAPAPFESLEMLVEIFLKEVGSLRGKIS